MKPIIPVTRPQLPSLASLMPLLEQIWDSRQLTNGGPLHQRFEQALADYLGVEHLSLFANGTLALMAALRAHTDRDTRGRDQVITTPYSFVATAHAVRWNQLTPVFVDIDPVTLNLDPSCVEAAITERTTAILAVHCYGRRCDTAALQALADHYQLRLIYDAAHAFAIRDAGGSLLRHGDCSVLSLHATKVFNTFEGGAIVSTSAAAKQQIDRLRNFGFVDETRVASVGINAKMPEFNAAIGLLQLPAIDQALAARARVAAAYRQALATFDGLEPLLPLAGQNENNGYFPIRVGAAFPLSRDALYEHLRAQGIHARRYFYPLICNLEAYRTGAGSRHPLPNANLIAEQVLCLPIYPDLAADDFERVIAALGTAHASHRNARPCLIPDPSDAR
ncbi:DegT/DnrJ/EryC1/StrS family aminotransferase [Pseudomonas sp. HR96]|uniref:DegT/DnrJ/EryC1/StrS aminotransferase family protein n=1 Tax=Pseudomonas sp. HR96 TaxID=1027966 RepID=UPI002A748B11|nr:DegT/DnrJ/EryC1/StrS family aminotransferase [Pseudomonas sp. HR96]WPP00065.1 DegT/DnrJ/EryC1/StrS family aminotransferase [Pseudomonas sp. HR96]